MARTEEDKDDIDTLKGIQRAAYILIFSICGLILVIKRDDLTLMWSFPATDRLRSVLQVTLFVSAIMIVLSWIAATAHEFQLWLRYLKFVFIRSHVYMAMFGLAVVLGMLLILVYNVVAFTGFYSCYLLFSYCDLAPEN